MHWRRKWQPLQCSCLEDPRDGGAWWAAVCGVAQSRTRLKRLSSSSIRSGKRAEATRGRSRPAHAQNQLRACLGTFVGSLPLSGWFRRWVFRGAPGRRGLQDKMELLQVLQRGLQQVSGHGGLRGYLRVLFR